MDADQHQDILKSLNQIMARRAQTHAILDRNMREFCNRLFSAIETVLAIIKTTNITGFGQSRRLAHPSGGAMEGLQVFIEDWSIILMPLRGYARPNATDDARIPPQQFKELCGRIAVFLTDDRDSNAFYDFLIFQDRSWFAWGYGWPKQQSDIENTDFEALALELLHNFAQDIFMTWNTRDATVLKAALDAKQRAYTFGLPGEELQGT